MRPIIIFLICFAFALAGCSGGSNTPVTPQPNESVAMGSVPIIGGSLFADGGFQATGMLGAYEILINPESLTAELIAKRTPSIGEDYIVSGISFFTIAPCATCLKIIGIELDVDGNAILIFSIAHPFPAGDTLKPPSAANRLDLDVFDLAMVIAPSETTATTYSLTGTGVYTGYCVNPDGYTTELANVISDTAALPYFLAIDDSDTGTGTYNKFAMGNETTTFDVGFDLSSGVLTFDMYLTMGYGFSAKKPDRLLPKYYNPEFNRKAAWKVAASPPEGDDPPAKGNTWDDNDNSTLFNVTVTVYDWQQSATVFTGAPEEFGDADSDNVFASSEISRVSVEIPGMNSSLQSVTTPDSGTGHPPDPCKYTVPIANQNLLPEGEYIGLVKVTDERAVLTPADGRDFLIDTPDGLLLEHYEMPEYATYQTFTATVVVGLLPVDDVTIQVNRGSNNQIDYSGPNGPWTLNWTVVLGAAEYAIYKDDDGSDGWVDWVELGTTTTNSYNVPAAEWTAPNHYVPGTMYVVRSRAIIGDAGSEIGDSQLCYIKANGFDTLIPYRTFGTTSSNGEGWRSAVEPSSYPTSWFIMQNVTTANDYSTPNCIEFCNRYFGNNVYNGDYLAITVETPLASDIPNSTVRLIECESTMFHDFNISYGGICFGFCTAPQPTTSWDAGPSANFHWADAKSGPEYYPYNDNNSLPFDMTDYVSGSHSWTWTGDVPQVLLGADVGTSDTYEYVGLAGYRLYAWGAPQQPYMFIDDMSIVIY